MARPRKDGLEYFPHDVDASTDPKLEPSILRFGAAAYAFYFIHLEYCYRSNDLCIDISDTEMGTEMREVIQRKLQVDEDTYKAILQSLLRHGAFDRQTFEETGKLCQPLKMRLIANGGAGSADAATTTLAYRKGAIG